MYPPGMASYPIVYEFLLKPSNPTKIPIKNNPPPSLSRKITTIKFSADQKIILNHPTVTVSTPMVTPRSFIPQGHKQSHV